MQIVLIARGKYPPMSNRYPPYPREKDLTATKSKAPLRRSQSHAGDRGYGASEYALPRVPMLISLQNFDDIELDGN